MCPVSPKSALNFAYIFTIRAATESYVGVGGGGGGGGRGDVLLFLRLNA